MVKLTFQNQYRWPPVLRNQRPTQNQRPTRVLTKINVAEINQAPLKYPGRIAVPPHYPDMQTLENMCRDSQLIGSGAAVTRRTSAW
ncbi:hypothetical protein ElyMa_006159300 [Elysia marginata]|uniref:Uncharacterized protein n=1 Tax=Elysia marginata TaxID=1093978 RepID=A0AAV4GZI1_9GAST|nr:hypothetical protein ElyMa_006159300 [Elysia marginata]